MIARKTWQEVRLMGLVYLVLLQLLLVPAILLWPDVSQDLQRPSALLEGISEIDFIRRMLDGLRSADESMAFLSYVAIQQFFKGINVAGISFAVLMGTGLVARERENQTLEFLLSRPIKRSAILWNKTWVVALCVVVPILLTSWSIIPLAAQVGETARFWPLTMAAVYASLFVLLFLNLTLLASVLCRLQVHVAFWIGGFVILNVCLFFINKVRLVSLFHFGDFDVYGPILAGNMSLGDLFWSHGVWLLGGNVVVYAIANHAFHRLEP